MCVTAYVSTMEQTVLNISIKRARTKKRENERKIPELSTNLNKNCKKGAGGMSSFNWPLTLIAWTVTATPLFLVDITIGMLTPVSVAMLIVLV